MLPAEATVFLYQRGRSGEKEQTKMTTVKKEIGNR